jgi:ribosomal protein S18 acetylase RimI-like enzyme
MASNSIEVRRLIDTDAEVYRAVRLEGLQQHPEAFGSTFEFENGQPLQRFAERLGETHVCGAFIDGRLVGTAGFAVQPGPKAAHKGKLWGMYVRPEARRRGVGRALVEAVLAVARERVELMQLRVVSDNTAALNLYERLGFRSYGHEMQALKFNGRYCDEMLMVHNLTSHPTA